MYLSTYDPNILGSGRELLKRKCNQSEEERLGGEPVTKARTMMSNTSPLEVSPAVSSSAAAAESTAAIKVANTLEESRIINQISQCFTSAVVDTNNRMSSELVDKIWQYQMGRGHLASSDLAELISHFVKTIATFAKSVPCFEPLSPADKIKVCSQSASIYIQYILAMYLTSRTGLEQLQWLIDVQVPLEAMRNQTQLEIVTVDKFLSPFIADPELRSVFGSCVGKIHKSFGHSILQKGLIANLILHSQEYHLDTPSRASKDNRDLERAIELVVNAGQIAHLFGSLKPIYNKPSQEFDITVFVGILKKMDNIFSACQLQRSETVNCNQGMVDASRMTTPTDMILSRLHTDKLRHTPMGYTFSDLDFIDRHYKLFKNGYAQVPVVPRLIEMYNNFTNSGIRETDKNCLPLGLRLFMERFRYLFHTMSDAFGISREEQGALWSRNCVYAVGLHILKMEAAESGNQQLSLLLGKIENSEFSKNVYHKDFRIMELDKVEAGRLTKDELDKYFHDINKTKDFVKDGMSFMLISMIVLLHSPDNSQSKFSDQKFAIQRRLLRMLQRHLMTLGVVIPFDEQKFKIFLHYIKSISQNVPKLITSQMDQEAMRARAGGSQEERNLSFNAHHTN